MLETQDQAKIAEFIKANIPQFPQIMTEEMAKFKEEAKVFAKNIVA